MSTGAAVETLPAGNPAAFDERLALLLTAARWLNVVLGLLVLVRDEVPTYQLAGPALLAVAAVIYTVRSRHDSISVPARYVALELGSVRVREASSRLRFQLVRGDVLGLQSESLGEVAREVGGALARDPVDEIE